MKIGILTIHSAHNYGSVLQAFALQETLITLGHNVEIINYNPSYLSDSYKYFDPFLGGDSIIVFIKNIARFFIQPLFKTKRFLGFKSFMKNNYNYSGPSFNEIKDFPSKYDLYALGSDQIWNADIMGDDLLFWGKLPKSSNSRIICYAASMDATPLTDLQKKKYKDYLCNFDFISVRESDVARLLEPLTSKTINIVLDPTLIAQKSIFDKVECKEDQKNKYGTYVLVYSIIDPPELYELAEKVAIKRNAQVLKISAFPSLQMKEKYKTLNNVTPNEFLSLIRDAECIISTSFHGSVFSILYQKDYYTTPIHKQGSRVVNLLNSLGLEDRIVRDVEDINNENIDYKKVDIKLNELRKQSYTFLNKALNNSNE